MKFTTIATMIVMSAAATLYAEVDILKDFDFSHCGYAGNNKPIPLVRAVYAIEPIEGDATGLIQQAIDKVSSLPLGKDGFRGAVLLKDGEFKVYGQLVISASGVVLRGSENTKLIAAGNKRRTLIDVKGVDDATKSSVIKIKDLMVEAGSEQITLENAGELKVGDEIFITRGSTDEWIEALKMNEFVEISINLKRLNWFKGSRDVVWDRTVTKIEGNSISFDGPITTEIDADYGQGTVVKYDWPGRIENVGIENLNCISEYDTSNFKDEEHSWICVRMSNVKNGWVRNLTATHFVTSAVMLGPTTSQITIDNCKSLKPAGELGGQRRRSFYNGGQLNLIQNCYAEYGRHDFTSGFCSAGPNVFKNCLAKNAFSFSGSVESWACGTLFDNVIIEGNALRLTNLGEYSQGAGWAASNCVLWNCRAGVIEVDSPPMSANYVYGASGNIMGEFTSTEKYLMKRMWPLSLFDDQLQRRGVEIVSAKTEFPKENPKIFNPLYSPKKLPPVSKKKVEIINGRFVLDGKALWGSQVGTEVWEGSMTPKRAKGGRPALTRFIPGRDGNGLTDNLEEIAGSMVDQDKSIMIQRPGLWYDKRRCDHQIVKRIDGNVWGPFLEMPWARSGIGIGWDGLSKFDLTKFNPWYFARIKEFADLCDQHGLILYNELHNNHNLVESASHWSEYPWRPTNHIQKNTDLTEPPYDRSPPSGDRLRIHIADEYYDISHPVRADLHKRYIIKCIDDLKDNDNVVHTMAFQYAGTTEFAKFFLDVVRGWEKENNKKIKLAIHTGKNVTDEILKDPKYADMIDVINMQYWQYFADGTLYALPAGENKAYREMGWAYFGKQKVTVPPTSEKMLYKQVREYRDVYPDKAIVASLYGVSPLPVLMAGGAYKNDGRKYRHGSFDSFVRTHLGDILWKMIPADDVVGDKENNWCLADAGKSYLIYTLNGGEINASLKKGNYKYRWFTPAGDVLTEYEDIKAMGKTVFGPPENKPSLLLIKKVRY